MDILTNFENYLRSRGGSLDAAVIHVGHVRRFVT